MRILSLCSFLVCWLMADAALGQNTFARARVGSPILPEGYRVWTDLQGQTLQARAFGLGEETVYLRKLDDGEILAVPLLSLSPEDNAYLRALNPQPGPAPLEPPSLRMKAEERRSADIDRDYTDLPSSDPLDSVTVETRTATSTLKLDIMITGSEDCDLEVRYYTAEEMDSGKWRVLFHRAYEVWHRADYGVELTTEPLLIRKKKTGYTPKRPGERNETTYPRDWVVGLYWLDEHGRRYLVDTEASERRLLTNPRVESVLARASDSQTSLRNRGRPPSLRNRR